MRKLIVAACSAAILLSPLAGTASAHHNYDHGGSHETTPYGTVGIEGCQANGHLAARTAYPVFCEFDATRKGGYDAVGTSWEVTVRRAGQVAQVPQAAGAVTYVLKNGVVTHSIITYSAANGANDSCATAIEPGDEVRASVPEGGTDVVAAGNNLPTQVDDGIADPAGDHSSCWTAA